MHSLNHIVLLFFRVASFKTPPQELPATDRVLATAIMLSLLVGLFRYFIVGGEYYSIFRVVIELLVPGVLIYLLLMIFKLQNRFSQTFAAVCGSGAIIYACALPVFPSFHAAADDAQYGLSVYIIILLDLWSVAVLAFILKHAVNVGFATGISLAVALVLLTLLLVEGISPSRLPSRDGDQLSFNSAVPPGQLPGQIPGQLPGQLPGQIPGQIPGQSRAQTRYGCDYTAKFSFEGGTKIDSVATASPTVNANLQELAGKSGPLCMSKGSFEPVDGQILSMLV